jgi:hypothetical protein
MKKSQFYGESEHWDDGFEFHWEHGCMPILYCIVLFCVETLPRAGVPSQEVFNRCQPSGGLEDETYRRRRYQQFWFSSWTECTVGVRGIIAVPRAPSIAYTKSYKVTTGPVSKRNHLRRCTTANYSKFKVVLMSEKIQVWQRDLRKFQTYTIKLTLQLYQAIYMVWICSLYHRNAFNRGAIIQFAIP